MSGDTPSLEPIEEVFAEANERFEAIMANPADREAWSREVTRCELASTWYELAHMYLDRGWNVRARHAMAMAQRYGAVGAARALLAIETEDVEPLESLEDMADFLKKNFQTVVEFVQSSGATIEEANTATQLATADAWRQWHGIADPQRWVRAAALRYFNSADGGQLDRASAHPADATEAPTAIDAALRDVPGDQIKVLTLTLAGYQPKEIAKLLDTDHQTITSTLQDTMMMLERIVVRPPESRPDTVSGNLAMVPNASGEAHEEYPSEDAMIWTAPVPWTPPEPPDEPILPVADTKVRLNDSWLVIGDDKYAISDVERIWVTPIRRQVSRKFVLTTAIISAVGFVGAGGVGSWVGAGLLASGAVVAVAGGQFWRRRKDRHRLHLTYRGEDLSVFETSDIDKLKEVWRRLHMARERRRRSRITANA